MRVVFLDVDGVLNTTGFNSSQTCTVNPKGAPWPLSQELLERFSDFLQQSQANIVVSSNWRSDTSSLNALWNACCSVGISHRRFIGQTPELRRPQSATNRRADEIARWLNSNRCRFGVCQWVAIDDLNLSRTGPLFATHAVQTDPSIGFQAIDVAKAMQLLVGDLPPQAVPSLKCLKSIVIGINGTIVSSSDLQASAAKAHDLSSQCTADSKSVLCRPHLDIFIDYCFAHFDGVALWTASENPWADSTLNFVLNKNRPWAFVCTRSRCKLIDCVNRDGTVEVAVTKPLKKVWRGRVRQRLGFKPATTVIVDDTPLSCIRNYGNAVIIPELRVENGDRALEQLMPFLCSAALPAADVRQISMQSLWLKHAASESAQVSEACPVCDGTKTLLDDLCPLCC